VEPAGDGGEAFGVQIGVEGAGAIQSWGDDRHVGVGGAFGAVGQPVGVGVLGDGVVDRAEPPIGVQPFELAGMAAEVVVEGAAGGQVHPAGSGDQRPDVAPGEDAALEQPGGDRHHRQHLGGGQHLGHVRTGRSGVQP
jgi:hypothetical protein